MTTIKVTHRKGIDDLRGLHAFIGSWGQGDHYYSNSVTEKHPDYVKFVFDCLMTQEAIDAEVERRKIWNENYVKELKESGRYGEEYEVSVSFKPHPMFDTYPKDLPHSYSFHIIDLSNDTKTNS